MYVAGAAAIAIAITAYLLRDAIIPFIVAFLIAYALNPSITWMEGKKIPRAAGVLILLAALVLAGVGLSLLIYPMVQKEAMGVAAQLPEYARKSVERLGPLLQSAGAHLGYDTNAVLKTAVEKLGTIPIEVIKWAYGALTSALSSVTALAGALLGFLIVPVAAFYFLLDYHKIRERFFSLIPSRRRDVAAKIAEDVNAVLSAYVRGQFTVVFTLSVIFTVGLSIIGAPMSVFLGIISGLSNIVPYMPLVAGLLPAVALTYLGFGDAWHPLAVLALYAGTQAFEGFYLTPRVMGTSLGLHPVVIMMAVFVGGLLFGLVGIIAAVPAAAVIKVFLRHLENAYRSSDFFKSGNL